MEPVVAPEQQMERERTEIAVPVQEERTEERAWWEQDGIQRQDRLRSDELRYSAMERQLIERNRQFLVGTNTVMQEERLHLGRMLRGNLSAKREMLQGQGVMELEKETSKSRKRRRKEYSELREQHGERISMETVYLKRDLEKYWAEREERGEQWEKNGVDITTLADMVELSPDMMGNIRQKGGVSYPDLARLLRVRDALGYIIEKGYDLEDEKLNPEQKMKVAVGVRIYPQLNMAIRRLLYENSVDMRGRYFRKEDYVLDEQGELRKATEEEKKRNSDMGVQNEFLRQMFERNMSPSETAGANEIQEFRKSLSLIMRREGEKQNRVLSEETQEALSNTLEEKRAAYREKERDRLTKLKELAVKEGLEEKAKQAAQSLWLEISGLEEIISEREIHIQTLESLIETITGDHTEDIQKLKLQLMIEKSDDTRYEAKRQSIRLERMLRVVSGDKSGDSMLTVAMRLELSGKYGLTEYEEGLALGEKSEEELERERELIEQDNQRLSQESIGIREEQREEEDRRRGREEKRLDELEELLGDRSVEELSAEQRKEYAGLIEKLSSRENRARKLRIRHLELWLSQNMPGLKNSLDIERMESLYARPIEQSTEDRNAEMGDKIYEGLLWQGRVADTLTEILGGEDNLEKFPLINKFLSSHSYLMTGEDILVQIMTQPALMSEIEQNFKDGEMTKFFLNLTQNLGSLSSTGAGALAQFATALGMDESVISGLGVFGSAADMVYYGVDTVKEAMEAHEARMRRSDLREFEREITEEETGSKEEAELMQNLVRTGVRTAGTDLMLHAEKSVTAGLRTVSSILSMAGVSAVAGVVFNWVTKLTDMAFSIAGKRERRQSRKQHVRDRFDNIFQKIRENALFRGISSRDLKHTVLRFAGVATGKRSEAALRSLTIESYRLLSVGRLNGKREEFRRKMLEKFHIEEDEKNQGATRERLQELLGKLGASDKQASNPLRSVLAIQERTRARRAEGRVGLFRRGLRGLRKMVAWDE